MILVHNVIKIWLLKAMQASNSKYRSIAKPVDAEGHHLGQYAIHSFSATSSYSYITSVKLQV